MFTKFIEWLGLVTADTLDEVENSILAQVEADSTFPPILQEDLQVLERGHVQSGMKNSHVLLTHESSGTFGGFINFAKLPVSTTVNLTINFYSDEPGRKEKTGLYEYSRVEYKREDGEVFQPICNIGKVYLPQGGEIILSHELGMEFPVFYNLYVI